MASITWFSKCPSHWRIIPLRHVFEIVNGSTPSSDNPNYWNGDIAWISPTDLGQLSGDVIDKTNKNITQEGYASCGTSLTPAGSIVLSTRAPIGHVALTAMPSCTNQGCRTLVFRWPSYDHRFFLYLLRFAGPELRSRGQGTTFQELSSDQLASLPIPVPPTNEQYTITSFLDRETARIDDLIAAKERLLQVLVEKRQAIITQAVTHGLDPTVQFKAVPLSWLNQIPANWDLPPVTARYEVQLGKMLDENRIQGKHLAPYLRNVDVQWEAINTSDLPEMDFSEEDRRRFTLRKGDILVCEGGEVGRSAIWQGQLSNCFYQKALHRLRPTTKLDDPEFFILFMRTACAHGVFTAGGNASTILHLPAEKLRVIRYPSPPLDEQKAIVASVHEQMNCIDNVARLSRESLDLLSQKRASLIAAATTGQISMETMV